jgi:hypothetical protein
MSNRLKLFRERMAAFEGAANPSEAIESGYYVHAPGKLLVDTISGRIALRPSSSHLLLGGIGSGKTTQLLVACKQINEIEDTHAIYVDVSLYTDISKLKSGIITAIIGLELANLMKDSEDENVTQYTDLIYKLAFGYEESSIMIGIKHPISDTSPLNKEVIKVKHEGIIADKSELYGNLQLVKTVSELSEATSEKYGNLVFLLDGLDRLYDSKIFIQLISTDVKAISDAGIGLVLVGPLTTIYGDYRDTVNEQLDYFYYQPFFDVENDLNSYSFFEKIIQTRSSGEFIEKSAIKALILSSGGVLRDFINLAQASIEATYLSGENEVHEYHVINAVDNFSRNQLLGISDDELKIIKRTLKTEKFIPRTDEDLRLLVRRLILEYRTPKKRYAVHPAIKFIIELMIIQNVV